MRSLLLLSLAAVALSVCPTLRFGSKGSCVRIVQKAVGVKVDGEFGSKTREAVKAFQRRHGLQADGVVGTNTWRYITASSTGSGGASGQTGKTAVEAAIRRLSNAAIFPYDFGFLKRVAWVESKFGRDFSNPRVSNFQRNGGMWQVDPIGVKDIKQRLPRSKKDALKSQLGIDVDSLNRDRGDLRDALKGAVAARALIYIKSSKSIPPGLRDQAMYWKRYYNTVLGDGTVQKFLQDVAVMP